jgi:non-ribosomal peptide synthetase component F
VGVAQVTTLVVAFHAGNRQAEQIPPGHCAAWRVLVTGTSMKQRLQHESGQENSSLSRNGTGTECGLDRSINELFEGQVVQAPDAIALVQGDACVSYRELNRRAMTGTALESAWSDRSIW